METAADVRDHMTVRLGCEANEEDRLSHLSAYFVKSGRRPNVGTRSGAHNEMLCDDCELSCEDHENGLWLSCLVDFCYAHIHKRETICLPGLPL